MRLKNKVCIVTGAADGIGLAISTTFAQEGATVVMCDINTDKCENESKSLNKQGGDTIAIGCSVGKSSEIRTMVAQVMEQYDRIDVLVNNAAVAISGEITEMPEKDWDTLMDVNLKGVFFGIQCVMPHMLAQSAGSIINLSSLQAVRSWDDWTAYATAKGGINAMTNQLAGQFGDRGIRVNSISPGAIMTPLNEKRIIEEGEGFLKSSIQQSAMKRMGTAEEVAQLAVLLASDEAKFITGEDIRIDGGLGSLPRYIED